MLVAGIGCSFDWAGLDPRESGGGTGGSSSTTTTGTGGTGSGTGAGTSSGTSTGTATGTGGAGTGVDPDCLVALEDSFDTIDDAVWNTQTVGTGCTATNPGGNLTFTCGADANPRAVGLTSVASYDLSDCGVIVELESLSVDGNAELELSVVLGTTEVGFVLEGLTLSARITGPNLNINFSSGFNPLEDKWWRIRGARGCVIWETSPDATRWSLFNEECDLALSEMRVVMRLGISEPMATATVELDNVNLP